MQRTAIYTRTSAEPENDLRRKVEAGGDVVVGVFADHAPGRRRYAGWRSLMSSLDQIEQIALNDVGDLPGRGVKDFLAILRALADHGVNIVVPALSIDTSDGMVAVIALIAAYRRAKLSQAIRIGQRRSPKRIGRPPIPLSVRRRIMAALLKISKFERRPAASTGAATVSALKKSMALDFDRLAA